MMTFILLCLFEAFNEEKREAASSKTVSYFLYALEVNNWKQAASFCTSEAQVHGVPAEQPEKRWSKSITTFLDEKPRWHIKILHWQCFENDGSATVLVDWRQGHLTVRSHFDLVKLQDTWKIDGMRYSTRRDAPGTAEQWKRLRGDWVLKPAQNKQEISMLKELSLDLQPHQFSLGMRVIAINFFGPLSLTSMRSSWTGEYNCSPRGISGFSNSIGPPTIPPKVCWLSMNSRVKN